MTLDKVKYTQNKIEEIRDTDKLDMISWVIDNIAQVNEGSDIMIIFKEKNMKNGETSTKEKYNNKRS
jgi:hypothetical protein